MTLYRRTVLGGIAAVAGAGFVGRVRHAHAGFIRLSGGCNSDNTPFQEGEYQTSPARDELLSLFRRVLQAAGASSMDVALLETEEPQIKAYVQYLDGKRTIVVNSRIVSKHLATAGGSALVALLGHEIAHLVLNHVFGDPLRDKWSEAAADRFAGIIFSRMKSENMSIFDVAEAFTGMADGGKYAKPERRKGFFVLGVIDSDQTRWPAQKKSLVVREIERIRARAYQPPSADKQHIKLYSRGMYTELTQLGAIGESFITNSESCHSHAHRYSIETLDVGVGFTRTNRTQYRVATLQFSGADILGTDFLQLGLQPGTYDDPNELFYNEAFDTSVHLVTFRPPPKCTVDGRIAR